MALPDATPGLLSVRHGTATWGYRRARGELAYGHRHCRLERLAILKRDGVKNRRLADPRPTWKSSSPPRRRDCWRDFCNVDTALLKPLYVHIFIHHDTRLVGIAGITLNPVAACVTQQARKLSTELADQAQAIKLLVHDRDTKFIAFFDVVFATDGASTIKSAVRAPPANAICERVIGP